MSRPNKVRNVATVVSMKRYKSLLESHLRLLCDSYTQTKPTPVKFELACISETRIIIEVSSSYVHYHQFCHASIKDSCIPRSMPETFVSALDYWKNQIAADAGKIIYDGSWTDSNVVAIRVGYPLTTINTVATWMSGKNQNDFKVGIIEVDLQPHTVDTVPAFFTPVQMTDIG